MRESEKGMSRRELSGKRGWMRPELVLVLVLGALLIAAVWLLGIGRRPIAFEGMNNPSMRSGLSFREDKKGFFLEKGDAYGCVTRGPGWTLPAGVYRLRWTIETDAENAIRIVSANGAKIEPEVIPIPANTWTTYAEFTLAEDAERVELLIDFEAGTYLRVQDISLYTPAYTDGTWTLTFLIFGITLLAYLVLSGRMRPQRWDVLMLLGAAAVLSSIPSLKSSLNLGYDSQFHLARLLNLVDGLRAGQLPVRVGGFTYQGYGAATSVFYPELFDYLPALMMLSGASLCYAVNVFLIAGSIATAACMYICGKRLLGGVWQGVCASLLYTLAAYRLTDAYTRFAVGEMLAIAVLPLFILGMYEVFFGDKRRWRTLAIGATCVFQSHVLTTLICAVCAAIMAVVLLGRLVRERRLGALMKAAASALLLNLFFLAPFVTLSRQGAGASMLIGRNSAYVLAPAQLLIQGTGLLETPPRDIEMGLYAMEIGLPLVLGGLLGLRAAIDFPKGSGRRRGTLLLCAAGLAFALMTTGAFPWDALAGVTRGMSDYLQFPSRLLMMADAMLALAGGVGICVLSEGRHRQAAVLVLLAAAFAVMPHLSNLATGQSLLLKGQTATSNILHGDYTLPGSDMGRTGDQEPLIAGDMRLEQYEKRGTRVSAQVEAAEDAVLTLPLFGFDGYAAEVDGVRMALGLGDNNRLTVSLPAGTSGTLRVWYEGKAIWRVFDAVSLVTALALVAGWLRGREKKNAHHIER